MREIIKQVIFEQKNPKKERLVVRSFPKELETCNEIVVISGIRRCGKSVLLTQIRNRQNDKDFFMNFDDERLINFKVEHFQLLHESFIELFGEQKIFYFDEIQNIPQWERFVRRLYDSGYKVFVTGSNATMLSRELGTHLTGRFCSFELFPFSFQEFLEIKDIHLEYQDYFTTSGRAKIKSNFDEFFEKGGFPINLQQENDLFLKSLYESIIYRDVMVRNKLTNEREIFELVNYLCSNVSRLSTYSSLAKIIGIKNPTTISNYIGYLQNSYLLFQVSKFDYSLKKQAQNPRKSYFIDNALINKLAFSFSDNIGHLLENLVFIELKRKGFEIYYHKQKLECDFLIKKGNNIDQAIQVCAFFNNPETKEREINGLIEALNTYELDSGHIITMDAEENIEVKEKKIEVKPAWKWLLNI